MIVSVLFINGFIQINLFTRTDGSPVGSNEPAPSFGNAAMNYTIVYGHPTDLTVTKTESVTIDVHPNGSIKTERVTVNFQFENDGDENCSFNLIDRAEYCDLDTIKFQKGTFPELLDYDVLMDDDAFGITILQWSNISVKSHSRAEYGYSMYSYKQIPITIETEYYINGSLAEIDPIKYAFNASAGSQVSNIIRIRNTQQDYFSTSDAAKPTTICLVTLMFPYEEDEADRDFTEPIFDPAPVMTNLLVGIQQVSWLALGDLYEINWSTTIQKGGGWGIIELQPIRIDIIQSSEITGLLFDGLSGLIGLLAAQQAYWAGLTLMSMIEELTGMIGTFQMLLNDIQVYLGMLHMLNYSLINSLLVTLIEIDMTRSALEEMQQRLNDTYYNDIVNVYNASRHEVRHQFRTILGITEPYLFCDEGTYTNSTIGIGIPNPRYGTGFTSFSIPLMLDYYSDIERRIIASFGAQLIELLGSPAIINMTDITWGFSVFINASVLRTADNTTDFYTIINIMNLTLPFELLGVKLFSLNLSRTYKFELNDVPNDRTIFQTLDDYFGHPVILSAIFPPGYTAPGSPGSDLPGFYTWVLDLVQVGRSALWWTLGNLTRSLATMMLLLDSSFSDETLALLNSTLSGTAVDLSTPISFESGFNGLNGLMDTFSDLEAQFQSPFGNPYGDLLPDISSMNMPLGSSEMALLNKFEFWTALKIYLEPVPRVRQLLNITLPLDLTNITAGMTDNSTMSIESLGTMAFIKSAESGTMPDWNWSSEIVDDVIQTNIPGETDFKRFEFQATGNEDTKNLTLERGFGYTFPASWVNYRFKINDTHPLISLVIVSQNSSGQEVYAIEDHDLSGYTADTWYEAKLDLRSTTYWEVYNKSFNPENIKRVEIRIIPHTTNSIALDLDYLNFTRETIPYPYDLTLIDSYLVGDGVDILPNITIYEKWTTGLTVTALQATDLTEDSIEDIIVGSNDGYVYLLNGSSGQQIWNLSTNNGIVDVLLDNVNGSSTPEIIIGTDSGNIIIINSSKDILANFTVGTNIENMLQGNLTGAESQELVFVSADRILAMDYNGNLLWNKTVKGTIRDIVIKDLDGNGLDEIGIITSKYKVYVLNGTNGGVLWDYITEERPTKLVIGDFMGDSNQELLYSTDTDYCVILDGNQGIQLLNFTLPSTIRALHTANLTTDPHDDLVLYTGLIIGLNLSAITFTPAPTLLWNFTSNYSYNVIKITDWSPTDAFDEVLIASMNNRILLFNSTGDLRLNFTTPRGVNKIITADLTQEDQNEFVFGLTNDFIQSVNATDQTPLWMTELGEEIITFQFIRTDHYIQLKYNLPDPVSDLLDMFGPSLSGTESILSLTNLEIPMGFGSLSDTEGMNGLDLSSFNLTIDDLPLKGIGLINMLEFEITLIQNLQDMKQVARTQRAFTGLPEILYTDKDTINYQLYPLVSEDSNARYYQYKIRNFEEQTITAQYFVLNMTYNGQSLDSDRISIEGWNGTHFIDLNNNAIYNITLYQLGLDYTNGYLIFHPFIDVDELEKTIVTVDWLGRELRVKVNTTGLNVSKLSVVPWVDVSIELPGIHIPGVSSVITYSKTIPTFIVSATPTPNVTREETSRPLLEILLTSPVFWVLSVTGLAAVVGLGYMQKREKEEVKKVASKKIIKWMKKRERSWVTLVNANVMTHSQYHELKRIRYRLRKEIKENLFEQKAQEIFRWKLIGQFISTVLLMRFWRGINKKSRLIWILNTLESMVLSPLKQAWSTFKTALGYLNPWDLDRQRKKELIKKAGNKQFWKRIEPPRKPIRKKRIEVFTTPISPKLDVTAESMKLKKPKKGWKGDYRTDGGVLLNKLNKAKKLPLARSLDGRVFYLISQRKFVGISIKDLAADLEISEYEVLVSIIRLLEKGLVFLLQEGSTVSEDLWDITSSLRKYDPELEKMIESIENLEDELTEGMEFLSTEIKNDKEPRD